METLREAKMMDVAEILRYDTHIAPDVLTHRMRDGLVWLAEVDGTIVGVLRFVILWGEHPFLEFLYIDAAYRGRGIGRLCVSEWERKMRALSYRYALTSAREDETARRFYEKLGYESVPQPVPTVHTTMNRFYLKKI